MIDSLHTFYYNGRRLSEFGAVIAQRPTQVIAERDLDFRSIPYHSGDAIADNGRYKNIVLKIKIRAVPTFCSMDFTTFCYSITEWLNSANDYCIYRDTYNPGYFRWGIVTHISDFEAVFKDVYEAEIEITCKPFLYRDSGLLPITITPPSTFVTVESAIVNPEKWESEPIITITGTGTFQIVLGNALMTAEVTDKMVIDKPNENVVDAMGVPCNDKITSARLPNLVVGENAFHITRASGTGDVTIEIIPNWRRL